MTATKKKRSLFKVQQNQLQNNNNFYMMLLIQDIVLVAMVLMEKCLDVITNFVKDNGIILSV